MKFEKVQPGAILLDIHKYKMGNTTMREWGLWHVLVISVDPATRSAMCKWNGNPATRFSERDIKKLRDKPSRAYLEQQTRKAARR